LVFKEKNELLNLQSVSSNENDSSTVFTDVNDFVELLVVDPDMVEVDMQEILKNDGLILNDHSRAVVVSNSDEAIICVKDDLKEEDVLTEEEVEENIEQNNETIFLENYEMNETIVDSPEQRGKWVSDADSAILFKCSNCEHTFDSEKAFQTHYCVEEDTVKSEKEIFEEYVIDAPIAEPPLKIREYYCNVCNRSYRSPLVFRLHVAQHKNASIMCSVCNSCFPDNNSLTNHIHEKHPDRGSHLFDIDDESAMSNEKQCDVCGKITDNLKQHKMYHTIKELEYCKERNKKFLKKWFFCHVSIRQVRI
jgi:hypothetical protein